MAQIRTFIAVRLSSEIRRSLAEAARRLATSGADVKWVPEDNFHITLKFLGNVESLQMDAVVSACGSAVVGVSKFGVTLAGVGAFPKPSRPSVVWVGMVQGGDELARIAERIDSMLEPLGFPREARPFSPHITLGRVRSPKSLDRLKEAIESLRDAPVGEFRVESIAVIKSELRPQGSFYSALAEFVLTEGALDR